MSGAESPVLECASQPPEDALSVIAGLEIAPNGRINYREEVHHAALPRPEVARGVLGVTTDGHLLKDQHVPKREISEIGDTFISVRKIPEGPANLLPIPAEFAPMLSAMRMVVTGDATGVAAEFSVKLLPDEPGWHIRLVPNDPAAPKTQIGLVGCGSVLHVIDIEEAGGVRRILTLDRQQ
jgi:hypothetical protein